MWRACVALSAHMAIRSDATLRAWIDPATTTCLFIDRSPGLHRRTHAPRPLHRAPAFSLCLSLSHTPLFFVTMWETALFNIPLASVRLGFPINKEVPASEHGGCHYLSLALAQQSWLRSTSPLKLWIWLLSNTMPRLNITRRVNLMRKLHFRHKQKAIIKVCFENQTYTVRESNPTGPGVVRWSVYSSSSRLSKLEVNKPKISVVISDFTEKKCSQN